MMKLRLICIAMLAATSGFSQGWTQKSNFTGGMKSYAFSFVIGSKAYVGTGLNSGQVSNDVWEYDPSNDTWTQRAAFIGQARYNAVSFVIGSKGYVGTGANNYQIGIASFFEYDPATNSWRSRASLANGLQRTGAVGFSIGSKGYVGLGRNNSYFKNDFWEYDPALNNWRQRASYPGLACADATAFTIGSKAYVGLGYNATTAFRTFYEYNQVTNSWTSKAQLPSLIRSGASAMVIGNIAYIALGSSYTRDILEYDPAINQWKRKMDFRGTERKSAAAFVVNGKGYIVGGMLRNIYFNDVWEYVVDTCRISALAKTHVKPSLCVNDSITMSANADSGLAYQWRLNGIEIPGANNRYYYAKTPGIYSVVLSGNYICSNVSSGINVVKPCNETPSIAEAGPDKRICIDDSAFIKGSILGTATKASWSGGNGVFLPNNDSLFVTYIPTAAEFTAGRIKLYLTSNDPDSTGPIIAGIDSMNIYISTGPPAPTAINGPWCFCANTTNYVYSVLAERGVIYSWVVSDDAIINSGQGTGSINVSYNGNAVSDTIFVSSTNGCGTSEEKFLLVNLITGLPAPTPPIIGINSGCPGTSSRYSVTRTTDAIAYTWTPPKGATINSSSAPVTIADTAVTVVYSKYYTGDTLKVKAINCFGSRTEEIMPAPRKYVDPPAEIIGSTVGCANDSNIYKFNKVPYAEYYLWALPIGATIKGKSLTYSSPDTLVTIVFSGAFSSDSIKVKAYGCAGFSKNTSLKINRAAGTSSCHNCTLSASIGNPSTRCAGDSVKLTSSYAGASDVCNSCELYPAGVYSSTGNVANAIASLSTPDGMGAWFTRGNSGITTRIIWDMGEVIPAGSTITVGVKTDGCSGSLVKSLMQFGILPTGGPSQQSIITQSANIAYYSSRYREFSFNTSVDGQYVSLSDEGGCGIRVDYIKWKKSCCSSSAAVTYLWSTGATTADIYVTPTSTSNYWVKVSDNGGCQVTGNSTINIVDKPVAKISGTGLLCPGSTTQLCADTAANYLWSDGSTTQCIMVSAPGYYLLTVSNAVCSATESQNITEMILSDNNECTTDACEAITGEVTHNALNIDDNNACTSDACDPISGPSHFMNDFDDNDLCTTDGCDPLTGVYHNSVNTDDQDACTVDGCNSSTGVYHSQVDVDDNNVCTVDACNSLTGNISNTALNTDDNNLCTTDGCNNVTGIYHNPVNPNDNDACTTDGCNPVTGVYNTAVNINDNNVCTVDACNTTTGAITHVSIDVDDNNVCTTDACSPTNGVSHVAINVNDNSVCTTDACDPVTGPSHSTINIDDNSVCTTDGCNSLTGVYHDPISTNDNDACTTDDCNAITGVYHTAVNMNDNNVCTVDACNATTGAITHVVINVDDNNACTTDACNPTNGVSHVAINFDDNNLCTADACDPLSGPSNAIINVDDNSVCTTDGCNSVTGVYHNPVNSNDNNACTTDGCNAITGVYHTQINISDNNACTTDACNSLSGVITHMAINLNDNNACTTDACNINTGPSHTQINIDDNNTCTADACDPITGPSYATIDVNDNNECTTDGCSSQTGVYHNAVSTNDGDGCTTDGCDPVTGIFNTSIDPDDNNECTIDACNSLTGIISHVAININDNNACTFDACDPIGGQSHLPVNIDDNSVCTTDACNVLTGVSHVPVNTNDQNVCTTDGCNVVTGVFNTPVNVDDGNSCTIDACNTVTGAITHTVFGIPAEPIITGTAKVCLGSQWGYKAKGTAGVTNYNWTVPAGVTIVKGQGTDSLVVKYATTFISSSICAFARTSCASSKTVCFPITLLKTVPAITGSISGQNIGVCVGSTVQYCIAPQANTASYLWTIPVNTQITSGAGSNCINVAFLTGFKSGNITVKAQNCVGNSTSVSLTVNSVPKTPGAISGPISSLKLRTGVVYSISAGTGATSYSWTVPAGAKIMSGQGTIALTVDFTSAFISGTMSVIAINRCGNSTARSISIKASAASATIITGSKTVCALDQGIAYELASQAGVTYTWTVPSGATITSGQGTSSIRVNWGATSGSVGVTRSTGITSTLAVTVSSCLKNTNSQITFHDPELLVNPNPTKGDFSLVFKAEQESEYMIIIRDMLGKIIYRDKIKTNEGLNIQSFKTDGYAKGLYILTLSGEKVNKSLRVAID